jgi:FtsH-binding integral membrane protein
MFFMWITATLFLYISSILMFLNERTFFAIILLSLGVFFTLSFIDYYSKHNKKKEEVMKKTEISLQPK